MLNKLYMIAKNTFIETLRQPIYAVLIVFAMLLFILSPSIAMYTLDEDVKLLRELGLSTLFLSGLFIAIFSATGAITEEIETGTITTILSKPVSRPLFVVGKFLGIASAVTLSHLMLTLYMLMMIRFGVLQTASDEPDLTVIVFGFSAILLTFFVTIFLNYIYDSSFTATGVILGTLFGILATVFLICIDKDWAFNIAENKYTSFDISASILLLFAILLLVAVAVFFSTRLNVVVTLSLCVAVFMLGLISDWVFGRFAAENIIARISYIITPNLQIYWVTDAIYEQGSISIAYLLDALLYTTLYITGALSLAVAMFQRKQIG